MPQGAEHRKESCKECHALCLLISSSTYRFSPLCCPTSQQTDTYPKPLVALWSRFGLHLASGTLRQFQHQPSRPELPDPRACPPPSAQTAYEYLPGSLHPATSLALIRSHKPRA